MHPALAQDDAPAAASIEEARSLFELGTRAVHEGRFRDADEALSRSLALAPHPATAFNLVVALRGLGAMVRASEVCEAQLRSAALDEARAAEARSLCDDVSAAIGRLTVRGVGERPFVLRLDGVAQGEIAPGEERTFSLDPGDHHLLALADGQSREHEVRLPAGGVIALALSAPRPESVDVGLVAGIAAGGAALVVVAVVIGVVAASSSAGPTYDYPVTMTLTRF